MEIQARDEGSCHVLAIRGSADVEASSELRDALVGAVESGANRLVLDLSGATFIGSDGLGILITAHLKAQGRGGFVKLASPGGRVLEVLKRTRLDHLFEVHPDVSEAVRQA